MSARFAHEAEELAYQEGIADGRTIEVLTTELKLDAISLKECSALIESMLIKYTGELRAKERAQNIALALLGKTIG